MTDGGPDPDPGVSAKCRKALPHYTASRPVVNKRALAIRTTNGDEGKKRGMKTLPPHVTVLFGSSPRRPYDNTTATHATTIHVAHCLTYLDINPRSQQPPQPLSRNPDALRVRHLGRRRLALPGAQVVEGEARGQPGLDAAAVHEGVPESRVQLRRQQLAHRRQRPVQRQAPADAARGEVAVALEDAERDALPREVLREQQAADAGADDEHRERLARGRRRGRGSGSYGHGDSPRLPLRFGPSF